MRTNSFFLSAALVLASFAASPAQASIVYNNDFGGVVSGDAFSEDAWNITTFGVTDSFSLSADATVTGFTIAIWMSSPDTVTSLNWYFTSAPFGPILASGSGPATTEAFIETNTFGGGYPVYSEAFDIGAGVALTAGITYWLQIDTAASGTSQQVYWDQSDGPSSAVQTTTGPLPAGQACKGLCTGSESFELLGTSTPEPGTVAMLGAGLAAIVGLRKRIQSKKSA
jgi:hypothetical protein